MRVWINGHEWAKRQLEHHGIGYEALDNGFFACDDAETLQTICDSFSARHIETFFRKWLRRLPHPFTAEDRKADFRYDYRLLSLECVAQHCAIASQTVERVVLPGVDEDEHRAPALRWGEPRVMALFSAICSFAAAPEGFTNRSLRSRVGMLHEPGPAGYTASRMSYDLRRLRANDIIVRVPKSHRYMLTAQGRRIALFMTKSYVRVVRPIFQRLDPELPEDAPVPLRRAWKACEKELDKLVSEARLAA